MLLCTGSAFHVQEDKQSSGAVDAKLMEMDISGSTIMMFGILMAMRKPDRIGLFPRNVNLEST